MTPQTAVSDPARRTWPYGALIALCWLAVTTILLTMRTRSIADFVIPDPDDYLRLVEVRDWIAGQSWFDVSQYRLNPPVGGDVHWSRLVDVPIAALIVLLTPVTGAAIAEVSAMVVVPLLLLGAAMTLIAFAGRILLDREGGIFAALLMMTSPYLVAQLAPLRIDHHGWQIVMAGVVLLAMLDRNAIRSGLIAGVATAFWSHVSIEGLPYLALIAALLGVRYVLNRREGDRLVAYLGALAVSSLAFYAATKAPTTWIVARCDAVSPPYLLSMLGAAAVIGGGSSLKVMDGAVCRLALLVAATGIAISLLAAVSAPCLAGPFEALDPLVYRFWYANVLEGRPVWIQPGFLAAGLLWPSMVGAVGTFIRCRAVATAQESRDWTTFAVLFGGAAALSLLVFRAQGVAHLYAVIGCAALLQSFLARIRAMKAAAFRVPLTALAIALPSPIPASAVVARLKLSDLQTTGLQSRPLRRPCANRQGLAGLAGEPPALLLAPLDIGPALLAFTPHSIIASGHHRNGEAMRDVILSFTHSSANALRIARRHGVRTVVYCRGLPEVELYRSEYPGGFIADLERGRIPDWLELVPVAGSPDLRVYRVRPAR